jgi:hypothetical protein
LMRTKTATAAACTAVEAFPVTSWCSAGDIAAPGVPATAPSSTASPNRVHAKPAAPSRPAWPAARPRPRQAPPPSVQAAGRDQHADGNQRHPRARSSPALTVRRPRTAPGGRSASRRALTPKCRRPRPSTAGPSGRTRRRCHASWLSGSARGRGDPASRVVSPGGPFPHCRRGPWGGR